MTDFSARAGPRAAPVLDARRDRVRRLARLLDTAVRIPGTNIRFGLDALLGLVPGAGDLIGAGLGAYLIYEGHRAGLPVAGLVRMALNLVVDTAGGAIPVVGDVFDIAWKANKRNLAILEDHLDRRARAARPVM